MADLPLAVVVTGANGHLGQAVVDVLSDVPSGEVLCAGRAGLFMRRGDVTARIGPGVDLTTRDGCELLAETARREFTSRFSVVNCIGRFPEYRPFFSIGHEESELVFRTNFLAVYFTALSIVPVMLERGGGHFVSFSTLSAAEAFPLMAAFDTAKAALEQMTKHLANEFGGQGLLANALALATLKTSEEMHLKPHGDHENWVAPVEAAWLVRDLIQGVSGLLNGNILRCYHHSKRYYATSYLERVSK